MLIADDDAAIRRLFETLARREGFECDLAANGREAIAALKEREYELLFLDIMMPRVDGWGVLDFGIAKQIGEAPRGQYQTEAGMVVGTVEYMSPEQALGKPLDGRTDIFSLGVVLYQALGATLPFQGSTATEIMLGICRDEPKSIGNVRPDLPKELAVLIARCLEKDQERRFNTAS